MTWLVADGADPLDPSALVAAAVGSLDLELVWLPRAIRPSRAPARSSTSRAAHIRRGGGDAPRERCWSPTRSGTLRSMPARPPAAPRTSIRRVDGSRAGRACSASRTTARASGGSCRPTCSRGSSSPARAGGAPPCHGQAVGVRHRRTDLTADRRWSASKSSTPCCCRRRRPPRRTPPSYRPGRTRAQDRAAAHRGSPFQLQAGPGTGKTRTLVKRILRSEEGVDPGRHPGSDLLQPRGRRAGRALSGGAPDGAPGSGSARSTLRARPRSAASRQLGLPPDPTLFDRSDAIAVLEEILPTLPLVHYRNLWDPALILRDSRARSRAPRTS